jgi:hypothetical protein
MATTARLGYGATFSIGDGGGTEVFTALSEVIEVGPPSLSRASVDATHHGSTERYQDFIPGLRDAGEVGVALNYTNAAYVTLLGKYNTDTVTNYRVTGPNGAIWQFSGFITSLEGEIPIDDKMGINVTFKVSGKPAYTAGS